MKKLDTLYVCVLHTHRKQIHATDNISRQGCEVLASVSCSLGFASGRRMQYVRRDEF